MPEVDLGTLVEHHRCFWLYLIGKGYTIDLPTLMLTVMGEARYSSGGLPYGLFITQLLEQVRVPTLPSDTTAHSGHPLMGVDILCDSIPQQNSLPPLGPRQPQLAPANSFAIIESLQRQILELKEEVNLLKNCTSVASTSVGLEQGSNHLS